MSATIHLHLRAARDRVIDLLGLGETHPLQDPEIDNTRLMVPFEQTARIPIDPGQSDAEYALYSRDEALIADTDAARGTGATTFLETPPIVEDVTYKIRARKLYSERQRAAFLHRTATVKVGLDASLEARILAPPIDPLIENPADTLPRIIDDSQSVEVEIDDAQEGVDYRLVDTRGSEEIVLSTPDVGGLGPGQVTRLPSVPLTEDTEIRIRATKTFDPAEKRETQTALLDIVLPLAVRADRTAGVSALPLVIGFGAGAAITVAGSRESTAYRLFHRPLADADFVYGDAGDEVLKVAVEGQPDVQVPPPPDLGQDPEGYRALGEWQTGNGGDLRLPIEALADDTLLIVQAAKAHWRPWTSVVQLAQAALILVEPDPAVDLALAIPVAAASMSGRLTVRGGRPGVFYTFRRGATGDEREPPAYFHQLDASNPVENKGLGLLRIEGDLAVTRDPRPEALPPEVPLAELRPPAPQLEIGSISTLDIELHVRAMKARTRVAVPLGRVAAVPAPPVIRFEAAVVAAGTPARILVVASVVGERYEPFLDGVSVEQGRHGNGEDLVFLTDPVSRTTTFEVHVARPGDPGLAVTRIVRLTVKVE